VLRQDPNASSIEPDSSIIHKPKSKSVYAL
jgi:hypothetical protein